jgi:hypothetical protein
VRSDKETVNISHFTDPDTMERSESKGGKVENKKGLHQTSVDAEEHDGPRMKTLAATFDRIIFVKRAAIYE